MTLQKAAAALAAIVTLGGAATVRAEIVNFKFNGTLDAMSSAYAGTPFQVTFAYDTDTLPTFHNPGYPQNIYGDLYTGGFLTSPIVLTGAFGSETFTGGRLNFELGDASCYCAGWDIDAFDADIRGRQFGIGLGLGDNYSFGPADGPPADVDNFSSGSLVCNDGEGSFYIYGSLKTASSTPAAPEPTTWALMMAGVGLAGGALRRRRRGGALALA